MPWTHTRIAEVNWDDGYENTVQYAPARERNDRVCASN